MFDLSLAMFPQYGDHHRDERDGTPAQFCLQFTKDEALLLLPLHSPFNPNRSTLQIHIRPSNRQRLTDPRPRRRQQEHQNTELWIGRFDDELIE